MGLLRPSSVARVALLALATLVAAALGGCGADEPTFRGAPDQACPERMAAIPGTHACIDRHEARIEERRAVPAVDSPAADGLTWHEAERACRAVGFRLCSLDEFERACGGADRERAYPYGPEHVPGRCNVAELEDDLSARAIRASGAFPECRTPEGVFDLSGNAFEWLSEEGGGGGLMAVRGGSAFQASSSARCIPNEHGWLAPDERGGGFRCCTTLEH
jgi:formylglycine-generating enzyme required for sulfatase activity